MIIRKFNKAKGNSTKAIVGSTAVAGGGYTVDLTPITNKIADIESQTSGMQNAIAKCQAAIAALPERFLSRLGDQTDYSYWLGALYSDFLQSGRFDNGVGYRLSGSDTATTEDKYTFAIKDVGWSQIAFTTVNQSTAQSVTSDTDEASDTLTASVTLNNTAVAGYLLVDCGATLTSERCFTIVARSVEYDISVRTGNIIQVATNVEAQTDGAGRFIIYFDKADRVDITIHFTFVYAFRHVGTTTSGTYRLYIRGTDYANSKTDCYGTASKVATVTASGFTVMSGDDGYRITSDGLEVTDDGGDTWTVASTGGGGTAATASEVNDVCDEILT